MLKVSISGAQRNAQRAQGAMVMLKSSKTVD